MVYFAHVTFNDRWVRELASGIESVVSGTYARGDEQAQIQAQIKARLDRIIEEAQQNGYIGQDLKPKWFKGKSYEEFLKEQLSAINTDFKLGIRLI